MMSPERQQRTDKLRREAKEEREDVRRRSDARDGETEFPSKGKHR